MSNFHHTYSILAEIWTACIIKYKPSPSSAKCDFRNYYTSWFSVKLLWIIVYCEKHNIKTLTDNNDWQAYSPVNQKLLLIWNAEIHTNKPANNTLVRLISTWLRSCDGSVVKSVCVWCVCNHEKVITGLNTRCKHQSISDVQQRRVLTTRAVM